MENNNVVIKQPLVSICIPTYNRASCLRKSLESIVTQEEFKNGLVEVIISDNASTDSTDVVGREFDSNYKNIHYFRNSKNILAMNHPLALSRANGKLLKLCNDTLIYHPGALRLFCESVKKYENSKPVLWFSNGTKKVNLRIKNENPFVSFENFINLVSYFITWIGTVSFWKEDFDDMEIITDEIATNLWHVKQICKIMSHKNSCIIIPDLFCFVQPLEEKKIDYGLFQVFYVNFLGIIKEFVRTDLSKDSCVSNETYEQLRKDLLLSFFPSWIAAWELQDKKLIYSKSENLKSKVIEAYKDESYFVEFEKKYKFVLFHQKIVVPTKILFRKIRMFILKNN